MASTTFFEANQYLVAVENKLELTPDNQADLCERLNAAEEACGLDADRQQHSFERVQNLVTFLNIECTILPLQQLKWMTFEEVSAQIDGLAETLETKHGLQKLEKLARDNKLTDDCLMRVYQHFRESFFAFANCDETQRRIFGILCVLLRELKARGTEGTLWSTCKEAKNFCYEKCQKDFEAIKNLDKAFRSKARQLLKIENTQVRDHLSWRYKSDGAKGYRPRETWRRPIKIEAQQYIIQKVGENINEGEGMYLCSTCIPSRVLAILMQKIVAPWPTKKGTLYQFKSQHKEGQQAKKRRIMAVKSACGIL